MKLLKQNQAGYILDSVNSTLKENVFRPSKVTGLLNYLSCFDLETNVSDDVILDDPILFVIHNIITKGAPTRPSIFIEQEFQKAFGKSEVDQSEIVTQIGDIKYNPKFTKEEKDSLFEALHIVDPRLVLNKTNYGFKLESSFEEDFIFKYLPSIKLGFLTQLLESQRKVNTIVKPEAAERFHSQRTDFSLEFPYRHEEKFIVFGRERVRYYNTGIVIEIDGSTHAKFSQKFLDDNRDNSIKETQWRCKRIKNLEATDFNEKIKRSKSINIIRKNYEKPLKDEWLNILQIALSPFAIARVQKTLLELILSKNLDLHKKEWKILAIERDVPCVSLAIEDLKEQIENLFLLSDSKVKLPEIKLDIVGTKEFFKSPLHKTTIKSIESYQTKQKYDLLIDVAILRRSQVEKSNITDNAKCYSIIRSSHYINSERRFLTTSSINYRQVAKRLEDDTFKIDTESQEYLTYFLQNIFRKKEFRPGQLPILDRALQVKSVIGLLPTGGGKSLTYQMAALLQPGVTIVIDPIKSLMQDQYDSLRKNGIDCCNYINSKQNHEEKAIATNQIVESKVLFNFISPERLQIENFRESLKEMHTRKVYFSYCVIDEVHCVSEWGHDFRTSYLSLGKNAIEYCKTKDGYPIPIFGLTATASFDVLSDVERELSGNGITDIDTSAIIRFENSNRVELQYMISPIEVEFERDDRFTIKLADGTDRMLPIQPINGDIKKIVAIAKQRKLTQVLNSMPTDIDAINQNSNSIESWTQEKFYELDGMVHNIAIDNFKKEEFFNQQNSNGGIIFCPHRTWFFGVTDKFKWAKHPETIFDDNGTIVHRKGDYVLDADNKKVKISPAERNGVADSIELENIQCGIFMGGSDDDETLGKEIETESFDNQEKFINNQQNLMVATKAFGMGIDKPNVRYTIHFNIPSSIESFVQEAGRAGRDRKIALSTILFNQQKVSIFNQRFLNAVKPIVKDDSYKILKKLKDKKFLSSQIPEVLKATNQQDIIDNEKEIIEKAGAIFVDKDNLLFFHSNSFRGQKKEMAVINELLQEILLPSQSHLLTIVDELKEEIDNQDISFKLDFNANRIYLNEIFPNGYGYIKIQELEPVVRFATFKTDLCKDVLAFVINKIKRHCPGYADLKVLKNWLAEKTEGGTQKGIEQRFQEIDFQENVDPEIVLPFFNKYANKQTYIDEISSIINNNNNNNNNNNTTIRFTNDDVAKALTNDFEAFISNLEEQKPKFNYDTSDAINAHLEKVFYSPRRKADTDKAIFRLTSIGIIDDYTIDYNKKTYTLSIVKKTEQEYLEELSIFMRKYYSANRVVAEMNKIKDHNGNTVLQKCLAFLVDFVYEEIGKKRLRSIEDMILACEYGLKENGNEELKEFIYFYFNSKYGRENYSYNKRSDSIQVNASLKTDTESGKYFDFEILWKYIEAINEDSSGSHINNAKHLRGAALLFLRDNLDNGTLQLLKSFTLFVLGIGKNIAINEEARQSLVIGFKLFREKYKELSFEEFGLNIERFKLQVLMNAHDSAEVKSILETIIEDLYLEFHHDWLKAFNNEYLLDYDRQQHSQNTI
jgi:ATP-dependent DNA helicase RecQ